MTFSEVCTIWKDLRSWTALMATGDEEETIPFIPNDFNWALLYGLLYGRHGNDSIAIQDESYLNRWKYKMGSIIWQWGPNWWKQVQVQGLLRGLSDEDLVKGSFQVSTQALNPAQKPKDKAVGIDIPIVDTINAQSTNQYRKNKTDAYSSLLFLLKSDVTEPFLKRFDPLFKKILPNVPCEECYEQQ